MNFHMRDLKLPAKKPSSFNAYVATTMESTLQNVNKNSRLKSQAAKICDTHSSTLITHQFYNTKKPRNLYYDLFTVLLLTYHMVQWMKVTTTQGQSYQDDEDYQ